MNSYKIVYQGGKGEIVEKKSRFLASVEAADTQEEALSFISQVKKRYWDASHNCFAYVIGKNQELQRCFDDGEPSGTAGRPLLELLLKEEIHNAVIVVTRYFGGTLLGTGGLVRAYQNAGKAGLLASTVIEKRQGRKITIETEYGDLGRIQYILGNRKIHIIDTEYNIGVCLEIIVSLEEEAGLLEEITEGTNGKAVFHRGEEAEFTKAEKEIILFEKNA